jgi:hypothetical protein
MPVLHIKTFLVMAHLFGLTLGLGGATILDIILLRLAVQGTPVQHTHAKIVALISKLVTWALVILWLSGIGFLLQYWQSNPELLGNPKLYAKISIVAILTANGVVLHAHVLPIVYQNVGRPLFDNLRLTTQWLMIACGTLSVISWYTPFFLGVARELNFVVPAWWILTIYAVLIVIATETALLLGPVLLDFAARRRALSVAASAAPANPRPRPAMTRSRLIEHVHAAEAALARVFEGEILSTGGAMNSSVERSFGKGRASQSSRSMSPSRAPTRSNDRAASHRPGIDPDVTGSARGQRGRQTAEESAAPNSEVGHRSLATIEP